MDLNDKTYSTENLLDASTTHNEYNYCYDNHGLNFQLLAKRVAGKKLTFKDCYFMVNSALRQVSK